MKRKLTILLIFQIINSVFSTVLKEEINTTTTTNTTTALIDCDEINNKKEICKCRYDDSFDFDFVIDCSIIGRTYERVFRISFFDSDLDKSSLNFTSLYARPYSVSAEYYKPVKETILELSKPFDVRNLEKLQFRNYDDTVAITTELFDGITQLKELNFNDTKFNLSKEFFDKNVNLEHLEIWSDELTLTTNYFENLKNLKTFELGNIKNIGDGISIKENRLEKLILSGEEIDHLTKEFLNYPSLKQLQLKKFKIDRIDLDAFSYLNNLEKIHFSSLKLNAISSELFQYSPKLKSITLEHIDSNQAILPSNLFANLTQLEVIIFHRGYGSWYSLPADIFKGLYNLKTLKLTNFDFFRKDLPHDLLIDQHNLKLLNFRSSYIRSIPNDFFQTAKSIEYLDLSDNRISGFPFWALNDLQSLVYLDVSANEIEEIYESQNIKLSSNLTLLELYRNRIPLLNENMLNMFPENIEIKFSNVVKTIRINPSSVQNINETKWSKIKLILRQNRFHCDCQLKSFLEVKDQLNYDLEDAYCATPEELLKIKIKDLHLSYLNCH